MKLTFFFLCLLIATVTADLSARGGSSPLLDYIGVTKAQVVHVPFRNDFSIDRVVPAGNANTVALYKIHLTFERGCVDASDIRFGNQAFPELDCVYDNNGFLGCFRGSETTPDAFFQPGGKVYFVSGIKLWVELTRGNRADVSIPESKIVTDVGYCETFNDQTAVMQAITVGWLTRNYLSLAQYYTYDVQFRVNVAAYVYEGLPVVLGYFALGDPAISDAFETLAINLSWTQSSGNLVSAAYNQTIKSLQLPEGQNVYWDIQNQFVLFNEYNQIYDHRVFVNGALLLQYYPSIVAPNITKTCHLVQDYCVGPLQQFADFDACVAFMNTLPLLKGFTAQPVGTNDVGCRAFHSALIPAFAVENSGLFNPHCLHSGPFNAAITMGAAGLFVTPCIDETGPFNPLPAAPTSRSVARNEDEDEQGVLQACASNNCRYRRVSQQNQKLFWYQVGFSQATEALIPAVAAILDQN